jgi:hypothetical protein
MTPHEVIAPGHSYGNGGPVHTNPFGGLLRWLGMAALGVAGALVVAALAVVATAFALIGLIVGAGFVLSLRMGAAKRRKQAKSTSQGSPMDLEARREGDGWVVEAVVPKSR